MREKIADALLKLWVIFGEDLVGVRSSAPAPCQESPLPPFHFLSYLLPLGKFGFQTEGLNKYNVLLRTTNTTQEELLVDVRVRVKVRGSTNVFVDALESLEEKMVGRYPILQTLGYGPHVLTLEDVTEILGIVDGEEEEEIKMPKRGQTTDVPSWLKKDFVERGKKRIYIDKVKTHLRESWWIKDVV
ncbi:hypothetical protein Tco_0571806 [Tanacetum coccineum]